MSDDQVFSALREEYAGAWLQEDDVARDPYEQFRAWFEEVVALELPMANAMTLATVDDSGKPSARVVLLKSFDHDGFVFFTNYSSRKSSALHANPHVALLFWWHPLQRQIRIEGAIERVSDDESNRYFASRPRESNLSAMASPQSRIITNREWLAQRVAELRTTWVDRPLERPPTWGGYRVTPSYFEFWQGQPDRLHDRLCYSIASAGQWNLQRLAP